MGGNEAIWEHCQLLLLDVEGKGEGARYHLGIRYFGAGSKTLSWIEGERAQNWMINPWEEAVAGLGRGGWELVSAQHANVAGDMGGGGALSHDNAVAYFKRPAQPDRAIDEPALELD